LIKAFYGQNEKLSYFVGCSLEPAALMEASAIPMISMESLPEPCQRYIDLHAGDMSRWIDINKEPPDSSTQPSAPPWPRPLRAMRRGGVKDNVIADPHQCKFDLRSLLCKGADSDSASPQRR